MVKTVSKIFGENIKAIREKKGLTVIQCAEACGMHPNAYNAYERGVRQPPLDKIFALADFFEITAAELIGETDETSENKFFDFQLRNATRLVTLAGYFADPEDDGPIELTLPDVSERKIKMIGEENNPTAMYLEPNPYSIKIGNKKSFIHFVNNAIECAIRENITFDAAVKKLIKEFNEKVEAKTICELQKIKPEKIDENNEILWATRHVIKKNAAGEIEIKEIENDVHDVAQEP